MSLERDKPAIPVTHHESPAGFVIFEPRGDRPAREEPFLSAVLANLRRQSQATFVLSLLFLGIGIALLVIDAVPVLGVALVVVFGLLALYSVFAWWSGFGEMRALLETPIREVRPQPDGLQHTGDSVSVRIGDGQASWVRGWLPAGYRALLARERRVWVLGPSARGRVVLVLPGSVLCAAAKTTRAPRRGSRPLPEVWQRSSAPKDDPVLTAHLGAARRLHGGLLTLFSLTVAAAAFLPALALFENWTPMDIGELPLIAVAAAVFVVLVQRIVRSMLRLRRVNLAARAVTWTPLPARLDAEPKIIAGYFARATARVSWPDGTERTVQLGRVSVDLIANVQASGLLWVIGTPEPNGATLVGVPGLPVLNHVVVKDRVS
ncbi:hypothetical protein ABZ863_15425 [Saccharomonospora sp. NPDC046836]|uniref:hypothetical protein n=1 Tax=Saccharomonospora sp. NPDC046836 TaxID=3156921 RepID=UPI0033F62FE9